MIEVKNLTKKYRKNTAVDNFSYSFDKNKVYGIIGAKNAGKSSLLRMLAGCTSINDGSVIINKDELKKYIRKVGLGYMPEDLALDDNLTVKEYLKFIAELKNTAADKSGSGVKITAIADIEDKLIKKLSDADKKLVMFEQAIMGSSEVIILDEPMAGLEAKQVEIVKREISALKNQHTVIISSGSLVEISSMCDEILVLIEGKLIAHDNPENLKNILGDTEEIVVSIAGKADKAASILKKIPEVKKAEGIGKDSDGHNNIKVEYVPERDIRDAISSTLANNKITVVDIIKKEISFDRLIEGNEE